MKFISPERQKEVILKFVEKNYWKNIEKNSRHKKLLSLHKFFRFFYAGRPEQYWVRLKDIFNYMKLNYNVSEATTFNRLDELTHRHFFIRGIQSVYTKGRRYFAPSTLTSTLPIPLLFGIAVSALLIGIGPLLVYSSYSSLFTMLVVLWATCVGWLLIDWRTNQ